MENQNSAEKNSMNQNITTIAFVIIAISLFVQTILKLSDGSESSIPNTVAVQPAQNPVQPPTPPQPNAANQTQVSFSETEHDFGKVKMGEKPRHTFKITNTGATPLQLTNATADNGLTLISWTNQSVAPQQSAEVVVELNSEIFDGQPKNVHVNLNASPAHQHFIIKANIAK